MLALFRLITDAGDLLVTGPLVLGLFALLWLAQARRAALGLAAGLAVCVGLLLVLKLLLLTCGAAWSADIRSPSGHTGVSTYIYGSYAIVLGRLLGPVRTPLIALPCVLWIAAIGVSRIVLHAHTPIEVLVGLLIGANALLLFARACTPPPDLRRLRPRWMLALLAGVMLSLHGHRAGAEGLLAGFSATLQQRYGLCTAPPVSPLKAARPALPLEK